ncbi:anoctamin-4-like [Onthophagus taurus]|uniref:anoctamin-4-like n=1 Tax=Onthophagus taurus TaxID=166361 RepID=UPI0039BDB6A0
MTTYYVDNNYTVFLAIAVTIWATIFLELWSRQEIIWQYKWNLNKSIPHIDEMANYKVRVHNYLKYNKHTKTETHYTPFYMKSERILISILGVIGGVIIVILTTATIVISEHFISYYILKYRIKIAVDHLLLLLRCYGYFVTIVLMRIYSPYLAKLAKVLTDQEIHRTKTEYLNAYILKSYTLAFFNSYIMTFYNCFVKESMYTNPGDYKIFHKYFGIGAVLCPPSMGCYGRIFLMTVFSILKRYILMFFYKSYLVELLIMGVKHLYKIIYEEITLNYDRGPELPQWEEEYSLKPISSIFFANAFTKRILEYGLLTFYSATVPVLPGLVLLNNIVELRLTAMSLIRHSRRNVPKRVLGLGSWNNVLQFVTRLSYLISGALICFTSTFVHRAVYYFNNNWSMKGFVLDTLTAFSVDGYTGEMKEKLLRLYPNVTVCYFSGLKNDYNQPNPYQKSDKFYHLFGMKFFTLVIYVHIVYLINSLLSSGISKMPYIVQQYEAYDTMLLRTENMEKITGGKSKKV